MTEFQSLSVGERCQTIRQHIPDSVRIVAVTKTFPSSTIREAYAAGMRDFGESRVQEAIAKQAELADLKDVRWHLIGHLQRNKARKAVQHFDWIHSVDSLKLAQTLDNAAQELGRSPKVCLQVKMRPDPNKFGWEPDELLADLDALDACHHLSIVGLMAIPPMGLTSQETMEYFHDVQALAMKIKAMALHHVVMEELSMGMSSDYAIAIQAGATIVRPGRILFGERA
jgi:hypothetical protein